MPNLIVRAIFSALLLLPLAPASQAEPGYQWQTTMEMDGMSIPGMGGSVQCVPTKGSQAPGMDNDKCKPIESKQSGNRFYWKAMCDGALTTGEFVYQGDTAYKGTMTVQEGRDTHVMKMTGKRLGKCEYSPPKMPKFASPEVNVDCEGAVRDLQPAFIFGNQGICTKHKKAFCARLGELSPESYAKVADQIKLEDTPEMKSVKGYGRMSDALKHCNMKLADMQAGQCRRASQALDYDFMRRYCPSEMQALCASGRAYTGYCGKSAGGGEDRGSYGGDAGQGSGYAGGSGQGGRSEQDSGGSGGLGDSLNKLKGLFGF